MVGKIIKAARTKSGLTQESLANLVGCSRSQVAQWENGSLPTAAKLMQVIAAFSDEISRDLHQNPRVKQVLATQHQKEHFDEDLLADGETEDVIKKLIALRRSERVDITGEWDAVWLTTVGGKENRNTEKITVHRRWNGSWQFQNEAVSKENPDGGYLWVGKLELFDNRHLLGFYVARDATITAKGSLCLELQTNGREIVGVWDGLNFDTMWATGLVAMCRPGQASQRPEEVLGRFIEKRPKMPYQ